MNVIAGTTNAEENKKQQKDKDECCYNAEYGIQMKAKGVKVELSRIEVEK